MKSERACWLMRHRPESFGAKSNPTRESLSLLAPRLSHDLMESESLGIFRVDPSSTAPFDRFGLLRDWALRHKSKRHAEPPEFLTG